MLRPSLALAALALALALALAGCARRDAEPRASVLLLTTTTTRDTGLLEAILPSFEEESGIEVRPVVAGSGDVLAQGARGEGDVLLAHAPRAEQAFMGAGHGEGRAAVMWNEFVVVGPEADPAGARGTNAALALSRVAASGAAFVSRGDGSGTHEKEKELWAASGLDPSGRAFYVESGQGQALTLELASEAGAYALTDRGTFLAHRKRLDLAVLVEGDEGLRNVYHVTRASAARFPKVNAEGALALSGYLLSPEGQARIAAFGVERFGEPLFFPAASLPKGELALP